jgi:hypothetical protein
MAKLVAVALVMLGFAPAAPAGGATITPTRTDDPVEGGAACVEPPLDCSLRNAVASAAAGDTVDLRAGPGGPYELTRDGPLTITRSIALLGPGAGARTIARTAGVGSVVEARTAGGAPPDLLVAGLSITGGRGQRQRGGGFTLWQAGRILLRGLVVSGNESGPGPDGSQGGVGGGVMSYGNVGVTIADSSISGNLTVPGEFGAPGGGIYHAGGPLRVVDSTIAGNRAGLGGGIYQTGGGAPSEIFLTNVTLASNAATRGGNVFLFEGDLTSSASIVANGAAAPGTENCHRGSLLEHFVSLGHNVESPTTQCGFDASNDLEGVSDPGLAGSARGALPLLSGSPAIDAGPAGGCTDPVLGPLTQDQLGAERLRGDGCDAGAVEAPPEFDTGYRGCSVVGSPKRAAAELVVPVGCETTRRVTVTGAPAVGTPHAVAAQARSAAAPASLGRGSAVVRRGRTARIRLRLTAGARQRIRRHGLAGVSLRVRARRVAR